MTQPTNLDELIEAASREANHAAQARERVATTTLRKAHLTLLTQALLVSFVAICGWGLYAFWAPISASQVERDLDMAIDQARQAVEASRGPGGELPSALPNAALSQIVIYQPDSGGYRLEGSIMGLRISLERDGSKRVVKEAIGE